MKNTLKNAAAIFTIATLFIACKGNGNSDADTVKIDSTSITTVTDTIKKDTNSMVPDSLKRDTTITTIKTETKTKTTEIKH